MNIFWFLPTHGDSRYLGTTEGARSVDLAYLQQIAGVLAQNYPDADKNMGFSLKPSSTWGRSWRRVATIGAH